MGNLSDPWRHELADLRQNPEGGVRAAVGEGEADVVHSCFRRISSPVRASAIYAHRSVISTRMHRIRWHPRASERGREAVVGQPPSGVCHAGVYRRTPAPASAWPGPMRTVQACNAGDAIASRRQFLIATDQSIAKLPPAQLAPRMLRYGRGTTRRICPGSALASSAATLWHIGHSVW
jgi:hypothetical protein